MRAVSCRSGVTCFSSGTVADNDRVMNDAILCRYERLQLQRVEGEVLSRELATERDAELLRPAVLRGGDQQHILPDARGKRCQLVGPRGAGELSFRAQGSIRDHAPQAAEKRSARDKCLLLLLVAIEGTGGARADSIA